MPTSDSCIPYGIFRRCYSLSMKICSLFPFPLQNESRIFCRGHCTSDEHAILSTSNKQDANQRCSYHSTTRDRSTMSSNLANIRLEKRFRLTGFFVYLNICLVQKSSQNFLTPNLITPSELQPFLLGPNYLESEFENSCGGKKVQCWSRTIHVKICCHLDLRRVALRI